MIIEALFRVVLVLNFALLGFEVVEVYKYDTFASVSCRLFHLME